MSLLNFLGEVAIFNMLRNWFSGKSKQVPRPVQQSHVCHADYYDRVEELNQQIKESERRIAEYKKLSGTTADDIDELQDRIDELESRLDDCDVMSDRYARIQNEIDTLQDRIDEIKDNEDISYDMLDELDELDGEVDDLYDDPYDLEQDDDW